MTKQTFHLLANAGLMFALLAGSCSHAFALEEDCKVAPSTWDDEFGVVPLGSDVQKAQAAHPHLKACKNPGECALIDDVGIQYSELEGAVNTKGLERVPDKSKLPFGLSRDDGLAQVTHKLFDGQFVSVKNVEHGGLFLISAPCYKNRDGVVFAVAFEFDAKERISGVGLMSKNGLDKLRQLFSRPSN